ncbi:MAG TPA: PP2C family protein-serine/threonine phosphatase [Acidimicrobiales bacterium]|nr:PP2C family protein-serine/threonine phosphatase [Acidimicrobiales bacterium]
MPPLDLGAALRSAHDIDPASVPEVVLGVATELGATDVTIYLVDFAQATLEPLPDRRTHREIAHSEDVATTVAGRSFASGAATIVDRGDDGVRIWVPIIEGSDRTGVLAVTVADGTPDVVRGCEELGLFAGYLIATQARSTDLYNLHRRRRSLSLAASMQWDLLPPLVLKTSRVAVSGFLEPAYEVGGDCFDYAMNDTTLDVAILDAMGHGVDSSLIASLTIGSYRHDRREGKTLPQMHANLERVMAAHLPPLLFATGQLARIDLESGTLSWTNAGHPLPLLVRQGQVLQELACPPSLPWGLGTLEADEVPPPTVASVALEPGDMVLFFTDGVTESDVSGGGTFGVAHLADLVGQHASDQLEIEEIVRRLARSVLEDQLGKPDDDATLVMVQWRGPASSG